MAASTEMIHVRLSKKTKTRAEKALGKMGLSVSDVVRMLLTRVAEEKAVPFTLHVPNKKTIAAMEELLSGGGTKLSGDNASLFAALRA